MTNYRAVLDRCAAAGVLPAHGAHLRILRELASHLDGDGPRPAFMSSPMLLLKRIEDDYALANRPAFAALARALQDAVNGSPGAAATHLQEAERLLDLGGR